MTTHTIAPHEIVWSACTAGVAARCLQLIADLGVADLIDDEPVRATDLAAACTVDPGALDRIMRLVESQGIFAREDGAYRHTPASRLLRQDHPHSMGAFARMWGLPAFWGSLTELEHSVRGGRPAIELQEERGLWAYLQDRPDEALIFGQAMTAKAAASIPDVLDAFDCGRFGTVADIGGGRGHLLVALLESAPATQGILFDLPEVVTALDLEHPRMAARGGDFFRDALPEADAYILMEVLHDWGDDECVAILSAIRRSAGAGATILIVEGLLEDGATDPRTQTLDVIMLAVTGGRERTAAELGVLLTRSGWSSGRVIETAGAMRIVEAAAA
jgi:hypothetical protein